jgi:hypothetical protein
MPTSPTQLSLKKLRADGYTTVQVTEHTVPRSFIKRDLFGFVDILAIKGGEVVAVQATSAPNVAARVKKIGDSEHIGNVREANWRVVVWGWRKKNGRWQCREVDVS